MARAVVVLLSLFVVAANSTMALSQSTAPAGYSVVARTGMYSGVEYMKLAKAKVPVVAHVAHVLPGAWVDLRVVNAHDRISTSPKELETTSSMCGRLRCIVGVNGDFHVAGAPAGAVVTDGVMLRSPQPDRPQLTVTKDGRLAAGPFPWTGSLTIGGGNQIAVRAVNAAPPAEGLAVYTPAYGTDTDASPRTELVVRAHDAIGSLNRPTDLDVIGLRTGGGPIPADGAVLSGEGAAAQQLRDLWARRQPGVPPRARLLVSSPLDASMSLGVEPVVLRDGRRATPWRDPNVINPRQPHTLVGWNKEGHTYLVAVDGRQAASEGVTMTEAADFLLGLGVTDAVSLDGGGGTTFVAGGRVWNRPSDNDPARPAEYEERGATNALVVMARPGAPLPSAAPPAPAPTTASTPAATSPPAAADGGDGETAGPSETAWGDVIGGMPYDAFSGAAEQLAASELPVGPSSSASGQPGRPATTIDGPAETTEDGASPQVTLADAPDRVGDDPSPAAKDLGGTVSLAASLASQNAKAAPAKHRRRTPFNHAQAGAIGGAVLLTAAAKQRRRRRPIGRPLSPAVPSPAPAAPAPTPTPTPDCETRTAELPTTAARPTVPDPVVQAAAPPSASPMFCLVPSSMVLSISPTFCLVPSSMVLSISPMVSRLPRAEGEGFEPSGLSSGGFQDRTVRPLRHPSGKQAIRPDRPLRGERRLSPGGPGRRSRPGR